MFFKLLYWDLRDSLVLHEWLYRFVINMPGRSGFFLRYHILKNRFKKAGQNLKIHAGFHYRNLNKLEAGDNVHFGSGSFIQAGGGVEIGSYTELGPDVKIWSQNHIYDNPNSYIEDTGYEYKKVTIGKNVWIGANSFIMPGAIVGNGCVISACSLVGEKIWPENSIISGNPARRIGERGQFRNQK